MIDRLRQEIITTGGAVRGADSRASCGEMKCGSKCKPTHQSLFASASCPSHRRNAAWKRAWQNRHGRAEILLCVTRPSPSTCAGILQRRNGQATASNSAARNVIGLWPAMSSWPSASRRMHGGCSQSGAASESSARRHQRSSSEPGRRGILQHDQNSEGLAGRRRQAKQLAYRSPEN